MRPFWLPALLVVILGGCSVHPLPEDVTGLDTVAIVDKVRCEASLAIAETAEALLEHRGGPQDKALAQSLREEPGQFMNPQRIRADLPNEEERRFYDRYIQSGLALQFTFDITEDTKDNGELDLARILTADTIKLGLKANDERSRRNVRTFYISDSFENLLKQVPKCTPRGPDLLYPITGSVGLAEVIRTFIGLNDSFLLGREKADFGAAEHPPTPVLADQLTFRTVIGGEVDPALTLTGASHVLHLTGASATSLSSRTDVHMLNIGLSFNPTTKLPAAQAAQLPLGGYVTTKSVLTKRSAGPAESRALEAITQQRIDTFLTNFGTAPP